MSGVCPTCGQLVRRGAIRAGVHLPRLLVLIFDRFARRKSRTINKESLAASLWPEKDLKAAKRCLAVNINRLNSYLEDTPYRVSAINGEPYRLVKNSLGEIERFDMEGSPWK